MGAGIGLGGGVGVGMGIGLGGLGGLDATAKLAKAVPAATCATKNVPLPLFEKTAVELKLSGFETPKIRSPLPVPAMVVAPLNVLPPKL